MTAITRDNITRDSAITEIRTALKRRSGKSWSVKGGKGTAWGWITVDAPPSRRTSRYLVKPGHLGHYPEDYEKNRTDTQAAGGYITELEGAELAKLLDLKTVHHQGVLIPGGHDYWMEYVDRANGRKPSRIGKPYWD